MNEEWSVIFIQMIRFWIECSKWLCYSSVFEDVITIDKPFIR